MPDALAPRVTAVRFNDREVPCPQGLTVAALLAAEKMPADAVATAVNGEFVARSQREQTLLRPGDTVLTFQAIVGG